MTLDMGRKKTTIYTPDLTSSKLKHVETCGFILTNLHQLTWRRPLPSKNQGRTCRGLRWNCQFFEAIELSDPPTYKPYKLRRVTIAAPDPVPRSYPRPFVLHRLRVCPVDGGVIHLLRVVATCRGATASWKKPKKRVVLMRRLDCQVELAF